MFYGDNQDISNIQVEHHIAINCQFSKKTQ